MLSGPGALLIFTLSTILLTSTADTDSGRSSGGRVGLTAVSLLRRSKQAKNVVSSSYAPAFVACDDLGRLPHLCSVFEEV